MPKSKDKDGKLRDVISTRKTWFEIPKKDSNGVNLFLVSNEVADYIESLEEQVSKIHKHKPKN